MADEKYQKIQGLKDELFQSKTEEAFNEVLSKLGEAVNADPTLSDTYKEKLRGYVKNLRTKKQEYWKKFSNKPAYAKKEVYLLRPETEEKLQTVLDLIAKRLRILEPTEPAAPARQLKPEFRKYVKRITDSEADPYEA